MNDAAWSAAPPELAPSHRFVDVWRVRLQDQPPGRMAHLLALLGEAERQRAERFRFPHKRNEFVVTRGLLRAVLGHLLRIESHRITFDYGEHGKPYLQPSQGALSFNLSHSHGLGLIAVTVTRAVGVDVELSQPKNNYAALSRRYFSAREAAVLMDLPPSERQHAFFSCWTRKEAFVKAVGKGISLGLDQFDVTLRPGEPAALLRTCRNAGEAARWSLLNLAVGDNYQAALAVEGDGFEVRCWDADRAWGAGTWLGGSEAAPLS